jgi:serine/threonine protein kinase
MPDNTGRSETRTLTEPQGGPAEAASSLSHGRYLLGDVIGSGGFGQVHRALDSLTGESVAIKFVPALSPTEQARVRRELAALRWLRLPGVVRLRDDGLDGAHWFMVTDLVDGRPFDTLAERGGWETWSDCVLVLLEVLARVHLAGVLHLDLKPGNVLVTPQGQIILLDLGLARGRAVPEVENHPIEGTPRYMAPEQRLGGPCDVRTDLYALGVMLARMAPDLPAAVRALISAMCANKPEDRPTSALEVYVALAGRPPFPPLPVRELPWSQQELRGLFAGAGGFTHLPEDAAALLWERTAGQPPQVQRVLESWLLSGQASWRDDGLVLDRLALERLGGKVPLDLLQVDLPELVREAEISARAMRQQGRLDGAVALLEVVLPLAREFPLLARLQAEESLLIERILAAVSTERPDAADLTLYALERAHPTPQLQQLAHLVRMVRAVLRREGARALEHAAELGVFAHPELEIRHQGFRARAAGLFGLEAESQLLVELETWASGDPLREAKRAGWLANHLYQRGLFREAALAHERAAAGKGNASEHLASAVGAACTWLEVPDLVRAEAQAQGAAHLARELRHSRFEALATWTLRTAAYRACRPFPPDPFMLESAAEVGLDLEGLFAATDAATAYRTGDRALTITLSERAAHRLGAAGLAPPAQLMRALAAYALPDPAALATLAEQSRDCPVPDMELQVLAFARWRTPDPPPDWLERAHRCAQTRPPEQWTTRLDVLSVQEALAGSPPEDALG